MPRTLQLLVAALALTALAAGGVVLGHRLAHGGSTASSAPTSVTSPTPGATPSPVSTPLADVDTTHLAVHRAAFCDAVPAELVADALGREPTRATSYDDGEQGQITRGVSDVAHEFDCQWQAGRGADVVTARAWVFAPPVTPDQAAGLVATQRRADDCSVVSGAPAYGTPSVATVCGSKESPQVSFRGLFGDAWLACSLTDGSAAASALTTRAEAWCAAVAQAAAAT